MKTLLITVISLIIINILAAVACAFEIDLADVGVTILRVFSGFMNS